jgi:hypothetical protein
MSDVKMKSMYVYGAYPNPVLTIPSLHHSMIKILDILAMATVTTWAMATATRVAGDGEGESDGGISDGGGDEGERRRRGRWRRRQRWWVSNGDKGRRQNAMARAARAIATAKRGRWRERGRC